MSRTYYHRHRRKPWKTPPEVRRLKVTKPERAACRALSHKAHTELELMWPGRQRLEFWL